MPTLFEQIKNDRNDFRKAGLKAQAGILTVLVGEIDTKSKIKELTDADIVAIIKKLIASNEETIKLSGAVEVTLQLENAVLYNYLPQQLTEGQLREIATHWDNLGAFMKHLKEAYAGRYDGKLAKVAFESVN